VLVKAGVDGVAYPNASKAEVSAQPNAARFNVAKCLQHIGFQCRRAKDNYASRIETLGARVRESGQSVPGLNRSGSCNLMCRFQLSENIGNGLFIHLGGLQ
jgi:hypothetical protein